MNKGKLFVTGLIFLTLIMNRSLVAIATEDDSATWEYHSILSVSEEEARAVVASVNKYASSRLPAYSDNGRTVGNLLEHHIFSSTIGPYNSDRTIFPDNELYYYSDGTVSVSAYLGSQCYGYSNYVTRSLFGVQAINNNVEKSRPNSTEPNDLKKLLMVKAQPGEHIRWSGYHSGVFLAANDEGYYFLQRLYTGDITLSFVTYEQASNVIEEKNHDFFIYEAITEPNTILPTFDVQLTNDGVLYVSSDYVCLYEIDAGFSIEKMKRLEEAPFLLAGLAGKDRYILTENFKGVPPVNGTLYYKITYIAPNGQTYETDVSTIGYDWPQSVATAAVEPKTFEVTKPQVLSSNTITTNNTEIVYGEWTDWQETPIKESDTVQVETKTESVEVVVGSHKEFNYSYYLYHSPDGTPVYTWCKSYAEKMGGGNRIYRGWGRKELHLTTLYDNAEYGCWDGGKLYFFEEVRSVQDIITKEQTFYRSRTVSYK